MALSDANRHRAACPFRNSKGIARDDETCACPDTQNSTEPTFSVKLVIPKRQKKTSPSPKENIEGIQNNIQSELFRKGLHTVNHDDQRAPSIEQFGNSAPHNAAENRAQVAHLLHQVSSIQLIQDGHQNKTITAEQSKTSPGVVSSHHSFQEKVEFFHHLEEAAKHDDEHEGSHQPHSTVEHEPLVETKHHTIQSEQTQTISRQAHRNKAKLPMHTAAHFTHKKPNHTTCITHALKKPKCVGKAVKLCSKAKSESNWVTEDGGEEDVTQCGRHAELVSSIEALVKNMERHDGRHVALTNSLHKVQQMETHLKEQKVELGDKLHTISLRVNELHKKRQKTAQTPCLKRHKSPRKSSDDESHVNHELTHARRTAQSAEQCRERTGTLFSHVQAEMQNQWEHELDLLEAENANLDEEIYRNQAEMEELYANLECVVQEEPPSSTACQSLNFVIEESSKDQLTQFDHLLSTRDELLVVKKKQSSQLEHYSARFREQLGGLSKGISYVLNESTETTPVIMHPVVCRFVVASQFMKNSTVESTLLTAKAEHRRLVDEVHDATLARDCRQSALNDAMNSGSTENRTTSLAHRFQNQKTCD